MQKLVLTVNHSDGCTYSYDSYICFTYESKEKAILDFGSALLKKIEDFKKENKEKEKTTQEIERLRSQLGRKSDKEKNAIYGQINNLYQKVLNSNDAFSFAEKSFSFSDFYKQALDENDNEYIEDPQIQTLDEWFNSN